MAMVASPQHTHKSAPLASSLDPTLLRNALRLLHCLQKERGSSCAFHANKTEVFNRAMTEARAASDTSAGLIQCEDLPIRSSLQKIRSLMAESCGAGSQQRKHNSLVFHRLFVCFNTLISYVVHDVVLRQILGGGETNDHGESHSFPGTSSRNLTISLLADTPATALNRHRRDLSSDINDKLASTSLLVRPEPAVTAKKSTSGSSPLVSTASVPPPELPPLPPQSTNRYPATHSPPRPLRLAVDEMKLPQPNPRVFKLLDLLHIFVQLKESAGVVRAILSSLLAMHQRKEQGQDDEQEYSAYFVNDLILQVENQRSLVHQLEELPEGSHRNLVLEVAQFSPRLQELQEVILNPQEDDAGPGRLSIDSLFSNRPPADHYDPETIWDMITLYVDKLHAVELFMVEELETSLSLSRMPGDLKANAIDKPHAVTGDCSVVHSMDSARSSASANVSISPVPLSTTTASSRELQPVSSNTQSIHLGQVCVDRVLRASPGQDSDALLRKLESIPAEELKTQMVELFKLQKRQQTGDHSIGVPVGSVGAHQRQTAQNFHADMHKALEMKDPLESVASKQWEISIYDIQFTKRIGQGASATTYLGTWSRQKVAVKVASITNFGLEGWRTEAVALQRLHHPNVIRLLGSVYHTNPLTYCLVLEYCNAGDLAMALRNPTSRNFFFHVSRSIANAMAYLHSRKVIHRDLKPGNVLCDGNIANGNFVVKVTDFGVASTNNLTVRNGSTGGAGASPTARNLTGETGTYRWMAPEVIRHESYSNLADVYSFAIMLWQFLTHEEPFWDVDAVEAARLVAIERKRPPLPKLTPQPIAELIEANWNDEPNCRWVFEKVAGRLEEIETTSGHLSREEKVWLETAHGHPVYNTLHDDDDDLNNIVDTGRKKSGTQTGNKVEKYGQNKNTGRQGPKRGSLLGSLFGIHKKPIKRPSGF